MARQQLAPAFLVQDAPTRLQGQVFTLRPGMVLRFPGGDPPRHRKYIRITNEDSTNRLYVVAGADQGVDADTNTVKLAYLSPNEFLELETNATLTIKNNGVTDTISPVHILELFYV